MKKIHEIILSVIIIISLFIYLLFNIYNNVFSYNLSSNIVSNVNIKNTDANNLLNKDNDYIVNNTIKKIEDKSWDNFTDTDIKNILNAISVSNIKEDDIKKDILEKKYTELNKTKPNNKEIIKHNNLCENIYAWGQENKEQLLIKNNCDIPKISKQINNIKMWKSIDEDIMTSIKYNWKSSSLHIWKNRTATILEKYWNNKDKVLDLLTIMTMECNRDNGNCLNSSDIWPFQINRIAHKDWYNKSYKIYLTKNRDQLFNYQLEKASNLLDSYEKKNCSPENIRLYWKWNTFEEKRWRCIAFHYNWNPVYKFSYNTLWFKKRTYIENILIKQWLLPN